MKSIKVFFMDKRLKDIYPYATKWEVIKYKTYRFFRSLTIWTIKISFVVGVSVGSYQIGKHVNPETVYAEKIVEVESKDLPPVMERIAKCESNNSHFDKNGQVLVNRTQDVGVFQINVPIHGKKASEMGLNLMNEKDNREFAVWLYKNFGSEPWIHSKKCWNK